MASKITCFKIPSVSNKIISLNSLWFKIMFENIKNIEHKIFFSVLKFSQSALFAFGLLWQICPGDICLYQENISCS